MLTLMRAVMGSDRPLEVFEERGERAGINKLRVLRQGRGGGTISLGQS